MLVTHLSTHDKSGGAAIAAWRLHQGIQSLGEESRMISRRGTSSGADVSCIASDLLEATDLFQYKRVRPAQPPGATPFSFATTTLSLLDHPWIAAADIIHLHWVANFISPEDVVKLCHAGKTVFWTLHDQCPYTGGCHYIGGDRRLEHDWDGTAQLHPSLHPLARLELHRKRTLLATSPIHIIAPSRWMAREAAASGVFNPGHIHHLPYGFDLSVYTAASSPDPAPAEDEIILIFGCQNVADPRKGYPQLQQALQLCLADPRFATAAAHGRIRLKTFGRPPADDPASAIPVTHLGTINEEIHLAHHLRSATAFLCPTLDDNLPNVVMEAIACGLPVLGFNTGGLPDMVTHQHHGLLAPRGDIPALARHLLDYCLDPALRQRLRHHVLATDLSTWTLDTQARRMLDLYQSVLPATPPRRPFPHAPPVVQLEGEILPQFLPDILTTLAAEYVNQRATVPALRAHLQSNREKFAHHQTRLHQEITTRQALQQQAKLAKDSAAQKNQTLQARLQSVTDRRDALQAKLKDSQAAVKTLQKQLTAARRPLHRRLWRALRAAVSAKKS